MVVSAAAASKFLVSVPASATAGVGFSFTVTAQDRFNNTAPTYTGTVAFASTDKGGATLLPASSILSNGIGTFNATLTTAGNQNITATDTVVATFTGVSGTVTVSAATATHFAVAAPGSATAGTGITFTVTAQDQFNNTDAGYGGTVSFTSSDHGASTSLPSASSLTNGVGSFTGTLTTVGSQTLQRHRPQHLRRHRHDHGSQRHHHR